MHLFRQKETGRYLVRIFRVRSRLGSSLPRSEYLYDDKDLAIKFATNQFGRIDVYKVQVFDRWAGSDSEPTGRKRSTLVKELTVNA